MEQISNQLVQTKFLYKWISIINEEEEMLELVV